MLDHLTNHSSLAAFHKSPRHSPTRTRTPPRPYDQDQFRSCPPLSTACSHLLREHDSTMPSATDPHVPEFTGTDADYIKASVHADPATGLIYGTTVHTHQPFTAPLISHIAGRLYQGGCVPAIALPPFLEHLISLYPDEQYADPPKLRSKLLYAMRDSTRQSLSPVDDLARWVLGRMNSGPTLVSCHMGLNRSGLIVARTLMLTGLTATEAIDMVRTQRSPAALNNPAFVRWLYDNE